MKDNLNDFSNKLQYTCSIYLKQFVPDGSTGLIESRTYVEDVWCYPEEYTSNYVADAGTYESRMMMKFSMRYNANIKNDVIMLFDNIEYCVKSVITDFRYKKYTIAFAELVNT